MQATARYIEELSEQLSLLAKRHEFHDLAYLLKMASDEARTTVAQGAGKELAEPSEGPEPVGCLARPDLA